MATRISNAGSNPTTIDCALKITFLIPLWILGCTTTKLTGDQIDALIFSRLISFFRGEFQTLHNSSILHNSNNSVTEPTTTTPSQNDTARMAAKHICTGNISRAMSILCPNYPIADPNSPDTQGKLANVFPTSPTPPTHSYINTTGLNAPVFQDKDVYRTIATSKRGSGAGISGLRFDHLRSLLDHNIAPSITTIVNTLIAGNLISPELNDTIANAAATLLLKDDSTIRPIMVLETYLRIIGRLIDQQVTSHIAPTLKHQFAIHNKNAISQVPTALRIIMANSPDKLTLKVDLRNAFGTIDRHYLSQQIAQHATAHPSLAYYWNLIYAKANAAITRGTATHQATTGVLQGDPLATLFFCMGINKALIDTGAAMHQDDFIFAYVDDIPIVTSSDSLVPTLTQLTNHLQSVGLAVNTAKCQIHPHSTNAAIPPNVPSNIKIVNEGIVILGTPIGNQNFESSFALDKANHTNTLLNAVATLNSRQQQLLLLRLCVHPRLDHLLRTVSRDSLMPAITKHQEAVQHFLINILSTSYDLPMHHIPTETLTQISLPLSMGGLGIRDTAALAQPIHLASFQESVGLLHTRLPTQFPQVYQTFLHGNSTLMQVVTHELDRMVVLDPKLSTPGLQGCTSQTQMLQQHYTALVNKNKLNSLLQHYQLLSTGATDQRTKHAIRYHTIRLNAVTQQGANAYIAAIPINKQLSMPSDLFTLALRRTLGLPLLPSCIPHDIQCPSCGHSDLTEAHIQMCAIDNGLAQHRHNAIVLFTANLLRHLRRNAQLEEHTGQGKRRWDITTEPITPHATAKWLLDFTIISPVQKTYLESTNPDLILPLRACEDRAQSKKHKYLIDMLTQPQGSTFTPLVIDSFGALHKDLKDFIFHLAPFADSLTLRDCLLYTSPSPRD